MAEKENIGAKVLSARFAKVLNLLATTLTTCLCNAREHVAKSGGIKQKTTVRKLRRFKVTILTSNKTQQNKNCYLKSQRNPAAVWQILSKSSEVPKVDNSVLSKEQRIRKQKSRQKAVFSR